MFPQHRGAALPHLKFLQNPPVRNTASFISAFPAASPAYKAALSQRGGPLFFCSANLHSLWMCKATVDTPQFLLVRHCK